MSLIPFNTYKNDTNTNARSYSNLTSDKQKCHKQKSELKTRLGTFVRIINSICIIFVIVVCVANVSVASSKANITHLDGSGVLIRGTSRHALTKGISLQSGDIMEFNEHTHAQVEFPDGAIAAFGSSSRILWFSHSNKYPTSTKLYLLTGSAKVAVPKGAKPLRIETQHLDFAVTEAISIILTSDSESEVFVESGTIRINGELNLREGEYCRQKTGRRLSLAASPPKSFVSVLPIQFRDPLPHLLARLGNRNSPLAKPRNFTYDEVKSWLNGPPKIRKYLAHQWRAKVKDGVFRKSLERNIKKHPEWGYVLYPVNNVDQTNKTGTGAP